MLGLKEKNAITRQEFERHPFLLSVDELTKLFQTNVETGLTSDAEIQKLQQKYGPNCLEGEDGVKWYTLLGKQISNAMILVCANVPCLLFIFLLVAEFTQGNLRRLDVPPWSVV